MKVNGGQTDIKISKRSDGEFVDDPASSSLLTKN